MLPLHLDFSFPLQDPVLVFSLVLIIILFSPILLSRIKIPAIIGLILAGVIIGPKGLQVIASDEPFKLFGSVGLLYIMFMAGIEIDMNDFKKNKWKSIYFGMNTFIIPMTIGSLVGHYVLGFAWPSAILLASMFASHTLLAYPAISKMGLAKIPVVNITVGGTMITDTLALVVLAVIAGMSRGEVTETFWITLGVSSLIFGLIVMLGFPPLARWFFRKYDDSVSQYIFILAMVYLAAFLAEMAGLETIIGAFFAGLALNRLIPHTSPMMGRIEFVGNALFIPFFLLSVGMIVDVRVLFSGFEAIFVAIAMTIVALGAKWLAAWITQKTYGWNQAARDLMFGLSSTQAAATLAVVFVGVNLGLFNEAVLNGTVVMILVTCLVGSYYAEKAGVVVAKEESEKVPEVEPVDQRILVSLHREERIKPLSDLAAMIRNPKSKEPIHNLYVAMEGESSRENVLQGEKLLEKSEKYIAAFDLESVLETRVDKNIATGIDRACGDIHATEIITGWSGNKTDETHRFNDMLDKLILDNDQTLFIYKPIHPLNTLTRIVLALPLRAEEEDGFEQWVSRVCNLSKQLGAGLLVLCGEKTEDAIEEIFQKRLGKTSRKYERWEGLDEFMKLARMVKENDLLFVALGRKGSPSYSTTGISIPGILSKNLNDLDIIFAIPRTKPKVDPEPKAPSKWSTGDQHSWGYHLYRTGKNE